MAWAKNGTPDTLGSAGDTLSISDLTEKQFELILCHVISSGTTNSQMRFNNDSTNEYANRQSDDGAADGTQTSTTGLTDNGSPAADIFIVTYLIDVSGEEKLAMQFQINPVTAGAGTAPSRREQVSKHVPSENTITQVDFINAGAGDFDTSSNLSVIGTD